jgi:PAS domain S-box-containing protein
MAPSDYQEVPEPLPTLEEQLAELRAELGAQRKTTSRLRQEQRRCERAAVAARSIIYDWNLAKNKIEQCSGLYKLLGWRPHEIEVTAEWLAAQVHPDDQARLRQAMQEAMEHAESFTHEYRLRHRDGHYLRVRDRGLVLRTADGRPVRIYGMTQDITEYKRADDALRASEERLRLAIDAAHLGTWDWDIAGDRSTWGGYHAQLFGLPEQTEISYQEFMALIYPEDRQFVERAALRSLEGEGEYKVEFRIALPDGSVRWMRDQGRTFRDEQRRAVRMLGVVQDITELKRAETEREFLLAQEKQLRHDAETANRAKDEFIALVTHELRSPLNAILSWAQALLGGADEETTQHALKAIERNARAQATLIEDLLDNSRILSGKLRLEVQPISLAAVISNALDVVRPAADARGITIKTEFATDTEAITGDPVRLEQVVWNLLSNAVKFTERGGQVTIRLERVDPHVCLIVSDTGRGINADDMPYIFNRYHQAGAPGTRRRGGLGLGLSLARHLTELHGGTIEVHSEGEGKGATFKIKLPVRAVRAEPEDELLAQSNDELSYASQMTDQATRETKPMTKLPALAGVKALIVDDESDARELLSMLLRQSGVDVIATSSAAEAMEELMACSPTALPDVIVSDIGMPGEDGYSLMKRIRQLTPAQGGQIPSIALTAFSRPKDRVHALSVGFHNHISKPVEPAELLVVISQLTGRSGAETGI